MPNTEDKDKPTPKNTVVKFPGTRIKDARNLQRDKT